MKKLLKVAMSIGLVLMIVQACNKEKSSESEHISDKILKTGGSSHCLPKTPSCGGVLTFASESEYDALITCLEVEYENWCNDFQQQNDNLNEADYNALIESTNWDEEETLAAYEQLCNNFYSLRKYLNEQVDIWLQSNSLNDNFDPDNHPIDDEVERTLYNNFGQIIIGTTLYDYEPNGAIFTIENPTCAQIIHLQTNPNGMIGQPGVNYSPGPEKKKGDIIPPSGSTCFDAEEYEKSGSQLAGNMKYRWRVHSWSQDNSWAKGLARVKSYKKRNGNGWKKWRPYTRVQVLGEFHKYITEDGTCDFVVSYDPLSPESCQQAPCWFRRHKVKAKEKYSEDNALFRLVQPAAVAGYPITGSFNISDSEIWEHNASW